MTFDNACCIQQKDMIPCKASSLMLLYSAAYIGCSFLSASVPSGTSPRPDLTLQLRGLQLQSLLHRSQRITDDILRRAVYSRLCVCCAV